MILILEFKPNYEVCSFNFLNDAEKKYLGEAKKDIIDLSILDSLVNKNKALSNQLQNLENKLKTLDNENIEFHKTKLDILTIKRTILETEVSILLNRLKLEKNESKYKEIEEEIKRTGLKLNHARVEKRGYEYIWDYYEKNETNH